jgi:Predicted pseudouridylate synthase
MFRDEVKSYQFSTFLIGLRSQKDNLQRERELMERLGSTARTYKAEFQFRLGTKIETELGYRVDFERPGLTFTINQENLDFFSLGKAGIPQGKLSQEKERDSAIAMDKTRKRKGIREIYFRVHRSASLQFF